ncbi:uncharacterized protein LOC111371580 [Olea europaea subsp. europaea]|uniref:Uncharacterized protein LOC111371580 n=1 Tax=Olea europaea subsp. europaea TaxID=158383 RepID=A0A8S0SYU9_OLEEU|nr:uncharacterized protein LOC111371580 [Olea europaea subsp. europaea]
MRSQLSLKTNSLALLEDGAVAAVLLGFAPPSTLLPASSSKLNEVPMPNPFHRPQSGFMFDVTRVEDSQLIGWLCESAFNTGLMVMVIDSDDRVGIQLSGN